MSIFLQLVGAMIFVFYVFPYILALLGWIFGSLVEIIMAPVVIVWSIYDSIKDFMEKDRSIKR